jgi:hypothetical protein
MMPIWSGFIADSVLYGGFIWLLWSTHRLIGYRSRRRLRVGLCPQCGYDLREHGPGPRAISAESRLPGMWMELEESISQMKRCAVKLALFLLLGAIINVVMAWGCTQFSTSRFHWAQAWAHALLESDWPADGSPIRYKAFRRECFGCTLNGEPGEDRTRQMLVSLSVGSPCPSFESWSRWNGKGLFESKLRVGLFDRRTLFSWTSHELPLMPLWPGFAINTIFYAAILWLPFAAFDESVAAAASSAGCARSVGTICGI